MTALTEYRTLTKRDFRFSRFGAFGALKSQKILLARRPVQRFFFLGPATEKYLELEVVTGGNHTERGAVVANVRCFSLFGQELAMPVEFRRQYFFADKLTDVTAQRLWVKRPKRAVYALVSLTRTTNGKRIGVTGNMKLHRAASQVSSVESVLDSRDRLALERVVAGSRDRADRGMGRRALARLIFLWQSNRHIRELAVLEDAEQMVRFGIDGLVAPNDRQISGIKYQYCEPLTGARAQSVPLSKWLRHEAWVLANVARECGSDTIEIVGPFCQPEVWLAAQLAAYSGKLALAELPSPPDAGLPWLSAAEIAAFVVGPG